MNKFLWEWFCGPPRLLQTLGIVTWVHSDFETLGYRTFWRLGLWVFWPLGLWAIEPPDMCASGPQGSGSPGLLDMGALGIGAFGSPGLWAFGPSGLWVFGPLGRCPLAQQFTHASTCWLGGGGCAPPVIAFSTNHANLSMFDYSFMAKINNLCRFVLPRSIKIGLDRLNNPCRFAFPRAIINGQAQFSLQICVSKSHCEWPGSIILVDLCFQEPLRLAWAGSIILVDLCFQEQLCMARPNYLCRFIFPRAIMKSQAQ